LPPSLAFAGDAVAVAWAEGADRSAIRVERRAEN
jgi:hypothetical protein